MSCWESLKVELALSEETQEGLYPLPAFDHVRIQETDQTDLGQRLDLRFSQWKSET